MGSTEYYCDPRRYTSVPHRLYHNLGNGKFEDVTEKSGLSESRQGHGNFHCGFQRRWLARYIHRQ